MKVTYRGHEVDAHRGKSMTGDVLIFWSIFRKSDMYEVNSGFEDSAEKVRDKIAQLKAHVDEEIAEVEQNRLADAAHYVDECCRIGGMTLAPDVRDSVIAKIVKALPRLPWEKRRRAVRAA